MSSHQKTIDDYCLQQAKGGSYFQGPACQRGHGLGGIFRALMRIATPIFQTAVPAVRAGATVIAKDALITGAYISQDALTGRELGESAEQLGEEAAVRLINRGTGTLMSPIEPSSSAPRQRASWCPPKPRRDLFSR